MKDGGKCDLVCDLACLGLPNPAMALNPGLASGTKAQVEVLPDHGNGRNQYHTPATAVFSICHHKPKGG